MMFYNHGEPSFVDSDEDHPRAERHKMVSVNALEDIVWGPANVSPSVAPGCFVKVLKFDPLTHGFTFMYCMTPNFWQDNISYHDCMEEGYHVWGTSWMMQFGYLPTGGYFWRPPWINHGAFQSDYGCIAIGRTDSQLHNYFTSIRGRRPRRTRSGRRPSCTGRSGTCTSGSAPRMATTTRTTSSTRTTTNTFTTTTTIDPGRTRRGPGPNRS